MSITNRDEFAGALTRQQRAVDLYDKYSPAAAVGLGKLGNFRFGSPASFVLGLGTTVVGMSLERGLDGIKAKSKRNPCNNCTKKYPSR
jgi:hypothetical protein